MLAGLESVTVIVRFGSGQNARAARNRLLRFRCRGVPLCSSASSSPFSSSFLSSSISSPLLSHSISPPLPSSPLHSTPLLSSPFLLALLISLLSTPLLSSSRRTPFFCGSLLGEPFFLKALIFNRWCRKACWQFHSYNLKDLTATVFVPILMLLRRTSDVCKDVYR